MPEPVAFQAPRTLRALPSTGSATWSSTLRQSVRSAAKALSAHKLRSALTMLGIIIGVAGVLLISAFGTVEQRVLAARLGQIGTNLINVENAVPVVNGVPVGSSRPFFTEQDVATIRRVPHVIATSPRRYGVQQLIVGSQNWKTRVLSAYPDVQTLQNYRAQTGRFFTNAEEASGAPVAVIGQTVAGKLFGDVNPIGQSTRIGEVNFSIIGVLASNGHNSETDLDDIAIIPFSIAQQRLYGNAAIGAIWVQTDQTGNIATVTAAVTRVLEQDHQIPAGGPDGFKATNYVQVANAARQEANTINLVLTGIAGVALLIGGFGIVTVMLTSVKERTREIGLRIAVGAQPGDVLVQFLLEAATVSLIGGMVGVALGYVLALVGSHAAF